MDTVKTHYEKQDLMYSGISAFLGQAVIDVQEAFDQIYFETVNGYTGSVQKGSGGYEIKIGEDIVYVIERTVFDIMNQRGEKFSILDVYKSLCTINMSNLKFQSKFFLETVKKSVDEMILMCYIPMDEPVTIMNWFIFYSKADKTKILINLN